MGMSFRKILKGDWDGVKKIYMEAFPKAERKPFFLLKKSCKKGKSEIWVSFESEIIAGFIVVIPYNDIVMVEYLAVSNKIRSKGTGTKLLQYVCEHYCNKRIVLLIEQINEKQSNNEQRIARKRFYFKNGFKTSNVFIKCMGGCMEILYYGGEVSGEEFIYIQSYVLGKILFLLSRTKVLN